MNVYEQLKQLLPLRGDQLAEALDEALESGLLGQAIPGIEANKGCNHHVTPSEAMFHREGNGDVWAHIRLVVVNIMNIEGAGLLEFLAGLGHDLAKAEVRECVDDAFYSFKRHENVGAERMLEIGPSFGLSDEEVKALSWAVEKHMEANDLSSLRRAKQQALCEHPHAELLFRLQKADALSNIGDHDPADRVQYEIYLSLKEEFAEAARQKERDQAFRDACPSSLVMQYGVEGPDIGRVLKAARAAWDADGFQDPQAADEFIRGYLESHSEISSTL